MKKWISSIVVGLAVLLMGCSIGVNEEVHESRWDRVQEMKSNDNCKKIIFPESIKGGDSVWYIQALAENRDYHIIVDSYGGAAYDTIAIMNRIAELVDMGYNVTTECYGYALSGGAMIFIMGNTRIVHDGASLMFHGAGFTQYNQRISLRSVIWDKSTVLPPHVIDSLWLIDEKFAKELYLQTELTQREIKFWLYADDYNWMSADEALAVGVATEMK